MTVSEFIGAVAGGGVTSGIVIVAMARLLATSWLRELENKFKAHEEDIRSLHEGLALVKTQRESDLKDANQMYGRLFNELRKLSIQVSYLNGQLAARGLVLPLPPSAMVDSDPGSSGQ